MRKLKFGTTALGVAALLALTGCAADPDDSGTQSAKPSQEQQDGSDAQQVADSAPKGSRDDPYPIGTTIEAAGLEPMGDLRSYGWSGPRWRC